ncbi:MAG: DJ-1/PfpI family protein [Candidatus Omnitrophica bacterium]|nr:DJ-1/PfpI family protein [Candidatus Omnitrophota bacterium]
MSSGQDKIVMVIANEGFRDEELLKPLKYFKDEGFCVDIASDKLGEAQGMLGATITPDLIIEEIDIDSYKALILVGGSGATVFWDSGALDYKLKKAYEKKKVIAAICISPVALAKSGILKGKRATVWPQESQRLIDYGAEYVFEDVVVDGNLVTAAGPHAALDFAKEIVKLVRQDLE